MLGKRILWRTVLLACWACLGAGLLAAPAAGAAPRVLVLAYHNVGSPAGMWTVSRDSLEQQFAYLREQGYQPLTLEQYMAAQTGGALPEKAVLLTFDDGYASFYREVFPLLQQYGYPAMLAVVTSWESGAEPPEIGQAVTWQQLREMEASGLVTVAAHSHALHHYVAANARSQGPAAATLRYAEGRYETPGEYARRIAADMQFAQRLFRRELGHPVAAWVWPYGAYTGVALELAKQQGFRVFFTSRDGFNTPGAEYLDRAKRVFVDGRGSLDEFVRLLQTGDVDTRPLCVGQLDLDFLYDPDPRQFEANIDSAIRHLSLSGANTVFLEAHADADGSGNVRSVYFHTNAAPVKADIFGYVVWRLQRANFRVYAWVSTLAGQWLWQGRPQEAVQASPPDKEGWYRRGTPFSPRVRKAVKALAADLAAYSSVDGVIFNDDLYFNDFEDFSPPAKAAFRAHFGRELTAEALKEPEVLRRWTRLKTAVLNEVTLEMAGEIRKYRPDAALARNIYAPLLLEERSQEWFAQDYRDYLQLYDYTVVMAYPRMEKAPQPEAWLQLLVQRALREPGAAEKVIFKLQAYDWNSRQWLGRQELSRDVQALRRAGAVHIAFYPVNAVGAAAEPLPF